jgi:hypothetical protein
LTIGRWTNNVECRAIPQEGEFNNVGLSRKGVQCWTISQEWDGYNQGLFLKKGIVIIEDYFSRNVGLFLK